MAEEEEEDLDLDVEEVEGSNKKLIIIFAAVIFIAVVGGGVGTFLLLQNKEVESAMEETLAAPEKKKARYYHMKPPFIVDFKVDGKQHFLQLSMSIMARENDVIDAARKHNPLLRNNLVLLFSTQEFRNLQTPEGKDILRQLALEEVQAIMQEELGKPGAEQVLFTNFVMQ